MRRWILGCLVLPLSGALCAGCNTGDANSNSKTAGQTATGTTGNAGKSDDVADTSLGKVSGTTKAKGNPGTAPGRGGDTPGGPSGPPGNIGGG